MGATHTTSAATPNQTAVVNAILADTVAVLHERGWGNFAGDHQEALHSYDCDGPLCLTLAVRIAFDRRFVGLSYYERFQYWNPLLFRLANIIAIKADELVLWNDAPGRSEQDIYRLLQMARMPDVVSSTAEMPL